MHCLAHNCLLHEAMVEATSAHLGEVASDSDHMGCMSWFTLARAHDPYLVQAQSKSCCTFLCSDGLHDACLCCVPNAMGSRALGVPYVAEVSSVKQSALYGCKCRPPFICAGAGKAEAGSLRSAA